MASNPSMLSNSDDELAVSESIPGSDLEVVASRSPSLPNIEPSTKEEHTKKKKPKSRKASPEYRQRSGVPSPSRRRAELARNSSSSSSLSETVGSDEDSDGTKRIRKRSSKSKTEVTTDIPITKGKGKGTPGRVRKSRSRTGGMSDEMPDTDESATDSPKFSSIEEESQEQEGSSSKENVIKMDKHRTLEELLEILVGPHEHIGKFFSYILTTLDYNTSSRKVFYQHFYLVP